MVTPRQRQSGVEWQLPTGRYQSGNRHRHRDDGFLSTVFITAQVTAIDG
jgi:hypothetical protein